MIYGLLAISVIAVLAAGVAGYFVGRFQVQLLDKITKLNARIDAIPATETPKPQPAVTMGVYDRTPQPLTGVPAKSGKAGIVETKTPQLLDWESKVELAKLEHGG